MTPLHSIRGKFTLIQAYECVWGRMYIKPLYESPSTLFHIKSFLILIDIQRVVFNVVRGKIDDVVEFVEDVPKQNFTFHH